MLRVAGAWEFAQIQEITLTRQIQWGEAVMAVVT